MKTIRILLKIGYGFSFLKDFIKNFFTSKWPEMQRVCFILYAQILPRSAPSRRNEHFILICNHLALFRQQHRYKLKQAPTPPFLSAVDVQVLSTRLVISVRTMRVVPSFGATLYHFQHILCYRENMKWKLSKVSILMGSRR